MESVTVMKEGEHYLTERQIESMLDSAGKERLTVCSFATFEKMDQTDKAGTALRPLSHNRQKYVMELKREFDLVIVLTTFERFRDLDEAQIQSTVRDGLFRDPYDPQKKIPLPKGFCVAVVPNAFLDLGMHWRLLHHWPRHRIPLRLMLANDSVLILNSLDSIWQSQPECDLWGSTMGFEISPHVQSYFLVFEQEKCHRSSIDLLLIFVRRVPLHEPNQTIVPPGDKGALVRQCEIGLSTFFGNKGLSFEAVWSTAKLTERLFHDKSSSAPPHWYPDAGYSHWDLLLHYGFPLLKKRRERHLVTIEKRAFLILAAHSTGHVLSLDEEFLT